MISLTEARAIVLAGCARLDPATLTLRDASGCAPATPVIATEAVPPFDNTSVDGYAVRADDIRDVPIRLRVVDEIPAGRGATRSVDVGQAIRIMTGAPIPPGADAVVMNEDTERYDDDHVTVRRSARPGDGVRAAGGDIRPGDVVIGSGVELRPAHLGVLASLGHLTVHAYPKPRVGVLSTGDELVTDGAALQPGQIHEANKNMLCALVARANAVPVDLGTVADDERALTAAFEDGIDRCDAVVTSGGVSVGDYDLVKVVLDKLGDMTWMQIAIKPAKPFAFGLLGHGARDVPVFGLPGNPVSSMVSFELLTRPALRQMMGHPTIDQPTVLAVADEDLRRPPDDGKVNWQRVVATFADDGRLHVRSTGAQGSHQLAGNALAPLPAAPGIPAGSNVSVLLLD